jgi:hypothetical protein
MRQVFLLPPQFVRALTDHEPRNERLRSVYVIRNGRLGSLWRSTARRTTTVAHQALDALVERTASNDLYRLQMIAEEDHEDFNIAYIDEDFKYPHHRLFSADYMQKLFEYSYAEGLLGRAWHKSLPTAGSPSRNSASPQVSDFKLR